MSLQTDIIVNMNKKSSNNSKIIIIICVVVALLALASFGIILLLNRHPQTTESAPVASEQDLDIIQLGELTEDLLITSSGTYTLRGETVHSVVVDAPGAEVELVLDGVQIHQANTAAIIGKAAQSLTINLASDSENELSDGGNSDYDACIYSNADLYFKGDGQLTVVGQQDEGEGIATEAKNMTFDGNGVYYVTSADDGLNAGGDGGTITINGGHFYIDASGDGIDSNKDAVINGGTIFVMGSDIGGDAGIDTDDGFEINGGTVIALGSDMLETPLDSSRQTVLAFTFDQAINKDAAIALKADGQTVLSFKGSKSFKTLLISSPALEPGDYTLYQGGSQDGELVRGICQGGNYTGGELISTNGSTVFSVESGINSFGRSNMPGGMGGPGQQPPQGDPPSGGFAPKP